MKNERKKQKARGKNISGKINIFNLIIKLIQQNPSKPKTKDK